MSDCLFCKLIEGTIPSQQVYSDDKVLVFKDIKPKAAVHLLLIPRKHIDSLVEVTPEDDELMAYMLRLLPILALQQGLDTGFRTVINTGPGGGQIVYHLHFHLLGGPDLGD